VKIPAVNIDIDMSDDGTAYVVTATPWPTIDSVGYPYKARLPLTRTVHGRFEDRAIPFTSVDLAGFVKKLMATYPKVTV
jgi:hypothetical protein